MQLTNSILTESLQSYKNIGNELQPDLLTGYSKVNFFIGPNNSGKSRMMRALFWGNHNSFLKHENSLNCEEIATSMLNLLTKHNIDSIGNITRNDLSVLSTGVPINSSQNDIRVTAELTNKITSLSGGETYKRNGETLNVRSLPPNVSSHFNSFANKYRKEFLENGKNINNVKLGFYIPIVRGMRPFLDSKDSKVDIYVIRTQKDYFNENAIKHIFGGYRIYDEVESLLLGNKEKRDTIREYEKFLATHFFHTEVTIIPQKGEDVLLIQLGESRERLIHDLGDGIQAIILLTFPIFVRSNEYKIFYIEEPELNIHPSLQRKLLKCFSEEFPKHQFFISTHSNHFLEALLDYSNTSLFSFKKSHKDELFHIQRLTGIQNDLLESLGVKNSSVFMSNCTIWVEGITDRLYIQKYLDLYIEFKAKEDETLPLFKEDQHYAFVEYAGSNIVHWDFNNDAEDKINALFISNKIMLIADSDYDGNGKISSKKQERFDNLKEALGKNFILIDGKEIENILSPKIIKSVVADYEKIPEDELVFKQGKDLQKKNIGEWINLSFEDLNRDYKDGNTIKAKLNFCRKAISKINSWNDLSNQAQKMTIDIFDFIKSQNVDYI